MNKCDFSPAYKQFASDLINTFNQKGRATYFMPVMAFTKAATNYIPGYVYAHQTKSAMRELMKSRGFKISFGIGVTLTQIPVVNVDKAQWPALIGNICDRLVQLMKSAEPNGVALSPATFRNIATIWPDTNDEFNRDCSSTMLERGYHLRFTAKHVFVTKKSPRPVEQPRVKILRGRCMLNLLLSSTDRRTWKRGFTHAVTIDVKARIWPDAAKGFPTSPSVFVGLPDAVLDCNDAALTCLIVGMHDVLLVNASALEQLHKSTFGMCDAEMLNARIESHTLNVVKL